MQNIDILIIDFGSQYTSLICKKIANLGAKYLLCHDYDYHEFLNQNVKGIILSGGPQSVSNITDWNIYKKIFAANIPILGICYGMQLIASYFKGEIKNSREREFGKANLKLIFKKSLLFSECDSNKLHQIWMSHADNVVKIANDFRITGMSENVLASIEHKFKNIYGIQFHPEVETTEIGDQIFFNFVVNICGLKFYKSFVNVIETKVEQIQNIVQNKKVLLALSGGVDSLVAGVLLNKAIGKNLHCFFVDNGLTRKSEALHSIKYLQKQFKMDISIIDAKADFLLALKNKIDPEKKRKVIGKLFIDLFEKEIKKNANFEFLAQGTILSDVIESADNSKKAHVIKSHHNVGGLPKNMKIKIIEPLRDWLKDEVRQVGRDLGIEEEYIDRQPIPGPGFAIRIIGEVNNQNLAILSKADEIFIKELKLAGIYDCAAQSFVIFLPIKSVGVMGDCRTYENVLVIRSVETKNFMTAKFSRLSWDFLEMVSTKIINEVSGINRVTYDITSKPPGTIEWE